MVGLLVALFVLLHFVEHGREEDQPRTKPSRSRRTEVDFKPTGYQIRYLRRGIPPRGYWVTSFYSRKAAGGYSRVTVVVDRRREWADHRGAAHDLRVSGSGHEARSKGVATGHCVCTSPLRSLAPGVRIVGRERRHVHERSSGDRVEPAPRAGADSAGAERQDLARQPDPVRAVLLLDRRHHVADPRRLHVVRSRRRPSQERHGDGDEEHPHDRGRHADVLLLRLVDLRLLRPGSHPDQPGRLPRLGRSVAPGQAGVRGRDGDLLLGDVPLVGEPRPEPERPHLRRLLGGIPPVLVDDGVDHVRRADRARPAVRLPPARVSPRLGHLDPRCLVGLELVRVPPDALGLPRLDRRSGRARRRGRVHARRPLQPRAPDREVHEGRARADLQAAQPAPDPARADAHLHRLLRLLRRVPRHPVDDACPAGATST